MASEDSQRVATRMEYLEYEWHLWNDGQHADAHDQGEQLAAGGELPPPSPQHPQEYQLTPLHTPRANGVVDLLGLQDPVQDSLQQWWDAAPPQEGQNRNALPQPLEPAITLGPGGGRPQLTAGEGAPVRTDPPPGFGLTMANATENFAGRRPEGPIQAAHHTYGGGGPRGDAGLIPAPTSE